MARAPAEPDVDAIAREVERTVRRVAPDLTRVIKYGAPTYRGRSDVCTIGVWTSFVSVGFWKGAELAKTHAILEGTGKRTRLVKLRSVAEARAPAFAALVRDAARLDEEATARKPARK